MIRLLSLMFVAAQSWAAPLLTDKEIAFSPGQNLMVNPGFEAATSNWTASGGTFSTSTTAANVGKGKIAGSWDSSAASQTLTSSAYTVPAGMYSRNAVASCIVKGSGATHKLQAYDGTNVLAEQAIVSQTGYARTTVNFVAPSSGSVRLRLVSVAADEPIIYIDDCFLGEAFNVGVVPAGALYWSGNHGNDCQFSKSGASYGDFGNDGSCTFSEVQNRGFGSVTSYGSTKPGVTWTPTQSGRYFVMATIGAAGDVNQEGYSYQLKSGSTIISTQDLTTKGSAGAAYVTSTTIAGILTVADLSQLTVHIEGYAGSGSVYIGPTGGTSGRAVEWVIYSLDQTIQTTERVERARISNGSGNACTSSPCSIERSSSSWLSVTRSGTGDYAVTFSPTFPSAPICVGTKIDAIGMISPQLVSSTGISNLYSTNPSGTLTDGAIDIICIGPR